jgi:manganese-dependent inorganic pyrophosphatase
MVVDVLVIGHRNPDTDSIVSAIALAELLSVKGFKAIPARAGELNLETVKVLNDCRLQIPALVSDVRPRVSDVMTRDVKYVFKGTPAKKAIDILNSMGIRSIPVVDVDLKVLGLFSVESFSKTYLKDFINLRVNLVDVPLKNIVDVVNCDVVVGDLSSRISGYVYVGGMSIETIKSKYSFKDNIVIVGDRVDVQLHALESRASLLIITGGLRPPKEVVDRAKSLGIPILISPYDTYTTAKLVDLSRPVEVFMDRAEVVSENTLIQDVINLMRSKLVRTVLVVDSYNRLSGIVTRSDLIRDYRKVVALVDHNELSQAVDGVDEAKVVVVVDHHRVSGDIKTREAILFRVEPVGSTSTIIWKLLLEHNLRLKTNVLKAMLYAVLSDTLLLKSPTTTEDDINCVNMLSRELGIKLDEAVKFVRDAIALSEPKDVEEIIRYDMKVYDEGGYKFAISQVFTVNPDYYISMKDKLISRINEVVKDEGLKLFILLITDYIENTSYSVVVGDTALFEEAFSTKVVNNYVVLKGITSRKQQVVPKLLNILSSWK